MRFQPTLALLFMCFICLAAAAQNREVVDFEPVDFPIETLTPQQLRLLTSPQTWAWLTAGQRATFVSVTHSLSTIPLLSGSNALSLVEGVDIITGEPPSLNSAQPVDGNTFCSIGLRWLPDAEQKLRESGWIGRFGWGHPNETGLQYRTDRFVEFGGPHVLINRINPRLGHAHIDYRAMYEGHMEPHNACFRAIGPFRDEGGRLINNFVRHLKWFSFK